MKDAARWVARRPRDKTPFIGRMANQEGLDTPLPRKNSDLSPRNNRLVITAPSSSSCNRTTKYILSFNARFERCAANKSRYIAARNNPSLDEEEREREMEENRRERKKNRRVYRNGKIEGATTYGAGTSGCSN